MNTQAPKTGKNNDRSSASAISQSYEKAESSFGHGDIGTQTIQKKENDTGLPDNLKAGIEQLSGYSMNGVKVHYNSSQPAQLQAHAYAQGSDIHLGPGQERHLPHEAWHVVQQKQGRVKATTQLKSGLDVNDDTGLEKEADVMGAKAAMPSFADTVPRAVTQRKLHGNQPMQFVNPKPLSEMVVGRMTGDSAHAQETGTDVYNGTNASHYQLQVYRSARDHNLNISQEGLNPQVFEHVPRAIANIQLLVRVARREGGNDENEEARVFDERFNMMTQNETTPTRLMQYFRKKVLDKAAAERYLAGLQHADQNFNMNLAADRDFRVERTQAGYFFGPSQTDLDAATLLTNRILQEAFEAPTEEGIFFRIALGIRETMDIDEDSDQSYLRIVSENLQNYLRPKIMAFIYTLPLADQAANGAVWGGLTLNDGITYADGRALEENDTWVRPKVREGWTQIRNVVAPAVLNHAGRATIQVDGKITRPFYNNDKIHMGWMIAKTGTVMHEFGHHLEDKAHVPHWVKLQQLLRTRSGNGPLRQIFPFSIPYVISSDEMRYDTSLPASGEMGGMFGYNVKYYPYGSTEVVSTAFEVFHNREKAFKIAVKDPEMFLAVMGILRGK